VTGKGDRGEESTAPLLGRAWAASAETERAAPEAAEAPGAYRPASSTEARPRQGRSRVRSARQAPQVRAVPARPAEATDSARRQRGSTVAPACPVNPAWSLRSREYMVSRRSPVRPCSQDAVDRAHFVSANE
jgi:hypothetical protein